MNQNNPDKYNRGISSAERIMEIVSKNGLATVLAVVFAGYLIWNNHLLTNRLEKYSESINAVNETMKAIDRRLEILEDRKER